MTKRQSPTAAKADPPPPQDTEHDDKPPHEHPKGGRGSRNPSADTKVDEGHRRNDGEGSIESVNGSDEDSRSRRRDLGP